MLASSAFEAHVMQQPSSPTEARCVRDQVDVKSDGQPDFGFRHDAENFATESRKAYLLECVEIVIEVK